MKKVLGLAAIVAGLALIVWSLTTVDRPTGLWLVGGGLVLAGAVILTDRPEHRRPGLVEIPPAPAGRLWRLEYIVPLSPTLIPAALEILGADPVFDRLEVDRPDEDVDEVSVRFDLEASTSERAEALGLRALRRHGLIVEVARARRA